MKNSRIFKALTISFALLFSILFFNSGDAAEAKTPAPAKGKVVYYTPHQDDDTLSMGIGIVNDINEGYDVHVVLLTDGAGTWVKDYYGFTEGQITKARNKEFVAAVMTLGVPEKNIHIWQKAQDGSLTVDQAKRAMTLYGIGAVNKTLAFIDPAAEPWEMPPEGKYNPYNPDHNTAGIALTQLVQEGVIQEGYLYWDIWKIPWHISDVNVQLEPVSTDVLLKVWGACDQYKLINLKKGRYGVGYLSVNNYFDWLYSDPVFQKNLYYKIQ